MCEDSSRGLFRVAVKIRKLETCYEYAAEYENRGLDSYL